MNSHRAPWRNDAREFYDAHAAISVHLITGKGFDAIAVQADWPDACAWTGVSRM
jgi:erythromycin esterase-like protein